MFYRQITSKKVNLKLVLVIKNKSMQSSRKDERFKTCMDFHIVKKMHALIMNSSLDYNDK